MRALILALALLCAGCPSLGGQVEFGMTGRLDGDVRTDGGGTWVAIGEADLMVTATLPGGAFVLVPVHVSRGHVWARSPEGDTIRQSTDDALPEWVTALYEPGELEQIIADLQPAVPAP